MFYKRARWKPVESVWGVRLNWESCVRKWGYPQNTQVRTREEGSNWRLNLLRQAKKIEISKQDKIKTRKQRLNMFNWKSLCSAYLDETTPF